jgi:DNA replicative helicase MCM subunit Mcm2 (Cdc46/Mcm family)
MKDTHDHISKKQLEIWLAKPIAERFDLAFSAIDEINRQTEWRIRKQNPSMSDPEVRIEFIRQNYAELNAEYLQAVSDWIRMKHT